MNPNMQPLIILGAIALYKTKDRLYALAYLMKNAGMSLEEATDMLNLYDRLEASAKADMLY